MCPFFIKTLNNFQPVVAETIVSKVQRGGKTRVQGGKAPLGSPSDPPMSTFVKDSNPKEMQKS